MKLRGIVLALLLLGALPAANIRQAPEPELRELMQRTVAEADSFQDRFDAEVWLVDMSGRLKRYVPDAEERLAAEAGPPGGEQGRTEAGTGAGADSCRKPLRPLRHFQRRCARHDAGDAFLES